MPQRRTRVWLARPESIGVVGSFWREPRPDGAESQGTVAACQHPLAGFSRDALEIADIELRALKRRGRR